MDSELLKTISLLSELKKNPIEDLMQVLVLKEVLQQNKISKEDRLMEFMTEAMKLQMLEKMISRLMSKEGEKPKEENILKTIQLYKELMGSNKDSDWFEKVLAIIQQSHQNQLEMMKEVAKTKAEEADNLRKLLMEFQEKWDAEKMEMLANFQQVAAQMAQKGDIDRLKELIAYYEEMENLKERLAKVLEKRKAREEPLVKQTPEGGLAPNLNAIANRVLDILEAYLTRPAKKQVGFFSPPPKPAGKPAPVTPKPPTIEKIVNIQEPKTEPQPVKVEVAGEKPPEPKEPEPVQEPEKEEPSTGSEPPAPVETEEQVPQEIKEEPAQNNIEVAGESEPKQAEGEIDVPDKIIADLEKLPPEQLEKLANELVEEASRELDQGE